MTTMIAEVYDAFLQAGAGEEKSRRAAEALAGHEDRFTRLEHRIDTVEATLSHRIDAVEVSLSHRIDAVEVSLGHRIDAVEFSLGHKIDKVEARLRSEQIVIRWMFGTVVTIAVAIALKTFLH